jgi:hypothetical protein
MYKKAVTISSKTRALSNRSRRLRDRSMGGYCYDRV